MWAFDHQSNWDYIESLVDIFKREGADIYYVELVAPQEIRLERNKTENRQRNKASKKNVEFSASLILNEDANYRLVSNDGEIPFDNYIKIDNSNLSPDNVAKMIKEKFSL
jgi:chloramphenicol 3-O-phosphotransferase